jgi:hypothetical protein
MSSDTSDSEEYEYPPLRQAAAAGNLDEVKARLQRWRSKISPSELTAKHLEDALIGAVIAGQSRIASFLLDEGANLDPEIIVFALGKGSSVAMFQVFLDHGWDINERTGTGAPALKQVLPILYLTKRFVANITKTLGIE